MRGQGALDLMRRTVFFVFIALCILCCITVALCSQEKVILGTAESRTMKVTGITPEFDGAGHPEAHGRAE